MQDSRPFTIFHLVFVIAVLVFLGLMFADFASAAFESVRDALNAASAGASS